MHAREATSRAEDHPDHYLALSFAKVATNSQSPAGLSDQYEREDIARYGFTPDELASMARALYDYNAKSWPSDDEATKPVGWLTAGSGCTKRTGTALDAHRSAWDALSATMSILVEVPIERGEDEGALLATLVYINWRVPRHQRQQAARRFARYVSRCIEGDPFVPAA